MQARLVAMERRRKAPLPVKVKKEVKLEPHLSLSFPVDCNGVIDLSND